MVFNAKAQWLDTNAYPFKHHYLELSNGKVHYIDEGKGNVILFLHGTPTWSFLYREHIKALSKTHRCIALDHLGFGMSEKSSSIPGTPQGHSNILAEFIDKLNLTSFTLIVHDFGGPIGLSYAIQNPEKIERVVLFNSWLWETKSNKAVQKIDKLVNSWMGKKLYYNLNFSPKVLLKKGYYDKKLLTKQIHKQYLAPFPTKNTRHGLYKIAQSLMRSSDFYDANWKKLNVLKQKPWLILWGMKDEFLRPEYLLKWKSKLPNATIQEFQCGHFVQEERPTESIQAIQEFLNEN